MCGLGHLRDGHQDLQNHILRFYEVFVNQEEHNPKTKVLNLVSWSTLLSRKFSGWKIISKQLNTFLNFIFPVLDVIPELLDSIER